MECINSQNEFGNNFELSQIDGALLMSFLEDSQVEEEDDHFLDNEKLSSVMRSLEAEINQYMVDKNSTTNWMNNDHPLDHHHGEVEGYDAEISESRYNDHHELDCNWMNMEMEVNSDWCMDQCVDEMDSTRNSTLRFGNDDQLDHYYFEHFNSSVSFEDHELVPHDSLWQIN
ncbi:OLC1v1023383C1 [Oldenlandia corymbosa var. corymbosa]|uniref:OLC1v1023383C1 n=1 Tax=Oldenlandia corymbosa var. corymbosa TaxID=529605 RepID=A0AAV1C190_OLDCO|nr:OLC1v1023383C1 [Oldenlandia corymbosa var. corymbosa]